MYPHMIHMWYLIYSSKLRTSLLRSAFFQHDGPVHRLRDCSLSTSPSVQLLSANIRKLCVGSLKLNNKDCLMNHHFCCDSCDGPIMATTTWNNMKTCIHPALFQDMLLLVDWIVWRIFSWHILGPLLPTEQCLNVTVLHGTTMSISFWLQYPHFLVNGEIYHKAEMISNHFKKALRDEIWVSQFCIKNRGSIKWSTEMFEASPSLSPFLWEYMTL